MSFERGARKCKQCQRFKVDYNSLRLLSFEAFTINLLISKRGRGVRYEIGILSIFLAVSIFCKSGGRGFLALFQPPAEVLS